MGAIWERALVTGASSGIGEQFARQLAASGTELVLVARRGDRLESLASELAVPVEVIVADLSTESGRLLVEQRLGDADRPIDCLIANAGIGRIAPVSELSQTEAMAEIHVNVVATVGQVDAVLPRMVAERAGAILITSSVSGFQPGPYNATYAATKAFVTSFAEAVHAEVAGHGVHVTALCPGATESGFIEANRLGGKVPGFLVAPPERVAAAGLVALRRNHAVCIPGVPNKLAAILPRVLPRAAMRRIIGSANRTRL